MPLVSSEPGHALLYAFIEVSFAHQAESIYRQALESYFMVRSYIYSELSTYMTAFNTVIVMP